MPKINKIRIVNLRYNGNQHIYEQTFDYYNGESGLHLLDNGGGKSVLVQMVLQPIIPKQNMKDRRFKDYFKGSTNPTYIMIEWLLDNNSGKLLTGIGIKKSNAKTQDGEESDNLKVITFASEYKQSSPFDIERLPLTYKEAGITKMSDFDKVRTVLSNAEKAGSHKVWMYKWEVSEDRERYGQKLAENRINQSEWKELMTKINEKEAGLANFFERYRTNADLVKWIIPSIEMMLDKNGSMIEKIKTLMKNLAEQMLKNEQAIKEKVVFERFMVQSKQITDELDKYEKTLNDVAAAEKDIGNLYKVLENNKDILVEEKTALEEKIANIKGLIKENYYDRLSFEYYEIEHGLQNMNDRYGRLQEDLYALENQLEEIKHQEAIMECARQYSDHKENDAQIIKKETMRKAETLAQEEIAKQLNDVEFTLKQKYEEKLKDGQARLNAKEDEERSVVRKRDSIIEECQQKQRQVKAINDDLITLGGHIAVFRDNEARLRKRYKGFPLERNPLFDEYSREEMKTYLKNLKNQDAELAYSINKLKNEKDDNDATIGSLGNDLKTKSDEKVCLEKDEMFKRKDLEAFREKKSNILDIYKKYEINEALLFDKEKAIDVLTRRISNFDGQISRHNIAISSRKKDIDMYESGQSFELPDNLQKTLRDNGIEIDFGYEWLKKYELDTQGKEEMLQKNPFIPYSIIMTKKDFEVLQKLRLEVFTSIAIPVLERESLEDELKVVSLNQIYSFDKINFLLNFNIKLLNEAHLLVMINKWKQDVQDMEEEIKGFQDSIHNINSDKFTIEGFGYIEQQVKTMEYELQSVRDKITEASFEVSAIENKIASLRTRNNSIFNELKDAEQEQKHLTENIADVTNHYDEYEHYLVNKKEQFDLEQQMKVAEKSIVELNKDSEILNNDRNLIGKVIDQIKIEIDGLISKHTNCAGATEGNTVNGSIEDLEAMQRGLNSEVGGRLKEINEELGKLYDRQKEIQDRLEEYHISQAEYENVEFNKAELSRIRIRKQETSKDISEVKTEYDTLSGSIGEKKKELERKKKEIERTCEGREPKEAQYADPIDFEAKDKGLKDDLGKTNNNLSALSQRLEKIKNIIGSMDDYRELANMIIEVQDIKEDPETCKTVFIRKYKECKAACDNRTQDLKNRYTEIRNEFINEVDIFRVFFTELLPEDKLYTVSHGRQTIDRIQDQINKKLDKSKTDMENMELMKKNIYHNACEYVIKVYEEMNSIDRNSAINIEEIGRKKMLSIILPPRESLINEMLEGYLDATLESCVEVLKSGKVIDSSLDAISTEKLFDNMVGINKVKIKITKVEKNKTKELEWWEMLPTSGGEKFVGAFVVFITLLSYIRGNSALRMNDDSKVLIMDNPFGPLSAEHLLEPMFEIAKKYNTQLICLTHLKSHSIIDMFNVVYSMRIEKELNGDEEYMESKLIKKPDVQQDSEVLKSSLFKVEQLSFIS